MLPPTVPCCAPNCSPLYIPSSGEGTATLGTLLFWKAGQKAESDVVGGRDLYPMGVLALAGRGRRTHQPAPLSVLAAVVRGAEHPRWLSPVPPARLAAPAYPRVGSRGVPHIVALLGAGARVGFCHLILNTSFLRLHTTHPAARGGEVKLL